MNVLILGASQAMNAAPGSGDGMLSSSNNQPASTAATTTTTANPQQQVSSFSYEFEKLHQESETVASGIEDKEAKLDAFRPEREYDFPRSHQRNQQQQQLNERPSRRSSMPTTASELLRFAGCMSNQQPQQQQQKGQMPSQKSKSYRHMNMHSNASANGRHTGTPTPVSTSLLLLLSAFEGKRNREQVEEGALYAATRATERAARSWAKKTVVLGPLGVVASKSDDTMVASKSEETMAQHRSSLLELLLEKDAAKSNGRQSTSSLDADVIGEENRVDDQTSLSLIHKVNPQSVKEQKLREVLEKNNAAEKRKTDPSIHSNERAANNVNASSNNRGNSKKNRRQYMTRRASAPNLKFVSTVAVLTQHGTSPEEALKEMAAMPKHILADIITAPEREAAVAEQEGNIKKRNNAKSAASKKKTNNRRRSMPTTFNNSKTSGNRNGAVLEDAGVNKKATASSFKLSSNRKARKSSKKGARRSSMPTSSSPSSAAGDIAVIYDWALAAKKQKEIEIRTNIECADLKRKTAKVMSPEEEHTAIPAKTIETHRALPKVEAMLPLAVTALRE